MTVTHTINPILDYFAPFFDPLSSALDIMRWYWCLVSLSNFQIKEQIYQGVWLQGELSGCLVRFTQK